MKLDLRDISKSFDSTQVLHNISMSFEDAHALVIIGPSGGGKTTLLRIMAGLLKPDSGSMALNETEVVFREEQLRKYRTRIGMVFQTYNLFPHMTALENISLPLERVHGFTHEEAEETAMMHLRRFKLEEHYEKKPAQMSGGQNQRVAICRAVAINPEVLLLDEPTSALDPEFTVEVLDVIEELREEKKDLILVTHHMGFARTVSDHLLFIADGTISEEGPAEEIFDNPENPEVKSFLHQVTKYE
ncbi:MAG: amino acid ABC transporter ATP-binding protein [Spirochaetales bacterium]|nr:amino acid ABC transporter ATP-binding protein [Spirochaetales bacterium]MCF7939844.1 amino acid ABC transporter ATP-binding protein [Spirochaetales bacterium]